MTSFFRLCFCLLLLFIGLQSFYVFAELGKELCRLNSKVNSCYNLNAHI
jgi:hypothetical protein